MRIEAEELLQMIETHERYLMRQLKSTENKRFYYQLQTVWKIKKYVSELKNKEEGAEQWQK